LRRTEAIVAVALLIPACDSSSKSSVSDLGTEDASMCVSSCPTDLKPRCTVNTVASDCTNPAAHDFDLEKRPKGAGWDVGADEAQ
jgi:hypothetical protein